MPKTVDTRKQCKGCTPQGGRCKFKAMPGYLYCGIHKNQYDRINERARSQCIRFDDQLYLPTTTVFFLGGDWHIDCITIPKLSPVTFNLAVFTLQSAGPLDYDVVQVKDPDENQS